MRRIRDFLEKLKIWSGISFHLAAHPSCIFGPGRARFLSDRETLLYLATHRKGIVRFGDGEGGYIAGYSYRHQRQDETLRRKLVTILRDYDDSSPALVAIPHDLLYGRSYAARKTSPDYWSAARWTLRPRVKHDATYGSAFCFRAGLVVDHDLRSYVALLVGLLRDRDVVYIGHDDGCPEIVPMRGLIKVPKQNAFEEFEEIKNAAIREAGRHAQPLVLVSCGITATALVWELNLAGVLAYDVGLIFGKRLKAEWNALVQHSAARDGVS